MMVAQAKPEGLVFLTADEELGVYGELKLSGYATKTGRPELAMLFTHREASVMTASGVPPSRQRRARLRPFTRRASGPKAS